MSRPDNNNADSRPKNASLYILSPKSPLGHGNDKRQINDVRQSNRRRITINPKNITPQIGKKARPKKKITSNPKKIIKIESPSNIVTAIPSRKQRSSSTLLVKMASRQSPTLHAKHPLQIIVKQRSKKTQFLYNGSMEMILFALTTIIS